MRNFFEFFNTEPFIDQDPRSFHALEYKSKRIILIGEWHSSYSTKYPVSESCLKKYQAVFRQWLDSCSRHKVKVFLESKENNPRSETGFIDSFPRMFHPNIQVNHADDRIQEDTYSAFGGFIYLLQEIKNGIICSFNYSNTARITCHHDWQGKPAISIIKSYAALTSSSPSLADIERHHESQLKSLHGLLERCETQYPVIAPYIADCLCLAYENFIEPYEKISAWCKTKMIGNDDTLDKICVGMIEDCDDLNIVETFAQLLACDVGPELDASWAIKIWQVLDSEPSTDIVLMIAGESHIASLLSFVTPFADTIINSCNLSERESSISPLQLETLLNSTEPFENQKPCQIQ